MNNLIRNLINNLIRNSKGLGSLKGLAFQKAKSLLYKGCWGISVGVSQKGHRVSSFPSFVLLSVIVRTHHQLAGVEAMCFCRPFDNRFILGDKRLGNLKAPMEKANLS